ncbi:kinetochore protein Nuf2-like [Tubulanus polymorphus]|uniref:kinetochore protein Nuf2-like n=1 Tax=Tubulanus polymorphus TaxID=672921 RepID=UPI003DA6BC20
MANQQFVSPIMKIEDVVIMINDMNAENKIMKISSSDITQPKENTVQQIYGLIWEELVGINVDDLSQPSMQAMYQIEHPEIHEVSLKLKHLSLCLSGIFSDIGVDGFSVMDLINPKPKKTLRLLSALLNFHIFTQARFTLVETLQEERKHIQESEKHLINENEELSRRINTIKCRKLEHEPECKQLEQEVAELSSKITEQQKLNAAAEQKLYEKDKEISSHLAQVDHASNSLKRIREMCDKLSGMIVASPDRVKTEEEHMKNQLKEMKERRTVLIEQVEQAVSTTKNKQQWISDYERILVLLENLKERYEEERSIKGQLESCIDQKEMLKYQHRSGIGTENQLKQTLDTLNDKINKIHLQYTRKIESAQEKKSSVIKSLEELQDEKDQDLLVVSETKKNMIKLQDEIDSKLASYQHDIQLMQSKYDGLLAQTDNYHTKLVTTWRK